MKVEHTGFKEFQIQKRREGSYPAATVAVLPEVEEVDLLQMDLIYE